MNDRIKHLLKLLNEDKRAFGRKLGLKPKYVKRLLSGKQALDVELCSQIVLLYPVHAHWLLTGEGPILRDPPPAGAAPSVMQSGIHQHNSGMGCSNTMQVFPEDYRMQVAFLREKVELLRERIEDKERVIRVLTRDRPRV